MTTQVAGVRNPTPEDISAFYGLLDHRLNGQNLVDAQHASMAIRGYYAPQLDFKIMHVISFEVVAATGNLRVIGAKHSCIINTLGKTNKTNSNSWEYDAAGTHNIMPLEDFIPHWQQKLAGGKLKSLLLAIPEPLTLASI